MTTLFRTFGLFALIGVFALAQATSAQGRGQGDPGQRIDRQIESLRTAVDLTDAQAVQVRALLDAQEANRPERGARGSGDREAMRAQRQAQQAEFHSQIEALLEPGQVERFRTWATAQSQQRRGGRRGGNGS